MCTSIFTTSSDQKYYLARTMDFAVPLESRPVFVPRQFSWVSESENNYQNRYAFVGTGSKIAETHLLADGVNEKGLSMAELYFTGEATYYAEKADTKINLGPHELITWVLGHVATIEELKKIVENIHLIDIPVPLIQATVPLHFVVSDVTGESIVLESNQSGGELLVKPNVLSIMTNSPELEWHLKNARHYLAIQNHSLAEVTIGPVSLKPTGLSSGTFGLPGGYTSSERFIRSTYLRHTMTWPESGPAMIYQIIHLLDSVTLPKGSVVNEQGLYDYSQYKAIMSNNDLTYYYQAYGTNSIDSINLKDLLTTDKLKVFDIDKSVIISNLIK